MMKLLYDLHLVFGTETPEEENFYLVRGKLECPNGYIGIHFVVLGMSSGKWYHAPDGAPFDGFPMWDGSHSITMAPFTIMDWVKLPSEELP